MYVWIGFGVVTFDELSPKFHCHPVMLPVLVSLNWTVSGMAPPVTFEVKLAIKVPVSQGYREQGDKCRQCDSQEYDA